MASVFMVKNPILKVSSPTSLPKSPSLYSRHRVSRVCFASPSKNAYEEMNIKATDTAQSLKEKVGEGAKEASKAVEGAQDKAADDIELVSNKTGESVQDTKDWAKEGAQKASDAVEDTKGKAVDNVEGAQKKAGEIIEDTKEWATDTKEWATGKAKEGVEAAQNAGEEAKANVEGAWESAKDATQKIADDN